MDSHSDIGPTPAARRVRRRAAPRRSVTRDAASTTTSPCCTSCPRGWSRRQTAHSTTPCRVVYMCAYALLYKYPVATACRHVHDAVCGQHTVSLSVIELFYVFADAAPCPWRHPPRRGRWCEQSTTDAVPPCPAPPQPPQPAARAPRGRLWPVYHSS